MDCYLLARKRVSQEEAVMKRSLYLLAAVPVLIIVLFLIGFQGVKPPTRLVPEILSVHPHETDAFTQGLLLYDGYLYESVGRYGRSSLRQVDPATGMVLRQRDLPDKYFAEGLARVENRLIQLTWREGTAFVYNLTTFEQLGTFTYEGEGWGLCYDGQHLYMSDGSSTLFVRDPETFALQSEVRVRLNGAPLAMLNELECVGDHVYANVWQTEAVVKIDKVTGRVLAVVDASGLLSREEAADADVLNGIAYNPGPNTFFITGKLWPKLFEVRFVEAP
jgi:glutaminyl-peptide cyclotransferase